jgi:hypothetical protein
MPQKREITISGDVAMVPLTRGFVAQIDASDLHKVAGFNWFAVVQSYTVYAVRRVSGVKGRGSKISMHRQIIGATNDVQVDHVDLNGLNNRRENLRIATPQQNCFNRRKTRANTSGFKGVCWNRKSRKWQAGIRINRRSVHLGLFETIDAAYNAYCQAANQYHGEYARAA